jgi:hypothetical protein
MTILCSNPSAYVQAHQHEIEKAITKTLLSGRYILGEEVTKFEEEFANYIGVEYGIGVASGTDALFLSLSACIVLGQHSTHQTAQHIRHDDPLVVGEDLPHVLPSGLGKLRFPFPV